MKTVSMPLLRKEILAGKEALEKEEPPTLPYPKRPVTRGDCREAPRPCPYVGCRYHLFLDVSPKGSIKYNFPGMEPWEIEETCALDVAEKYPNGLTTTELGTLVGICGQAVSAISLIAIRKIYRSGVNPESPLETIMETFASVENSPIDREILSESLTSSEEDIFAKFGRIPK